MIQVILLFVLAGYSFAAQPADPRPLAAPAGAVPAGWRLVFADEFSGAADSWRENWRSDASALSHILSSRWPENVTIQNGMLRLLNRKESRAGQEWTAGSIGTLREFKYGYFEARYRYGTAPGLNNSFWLMTRGKPKGNSGGLTTFELDINEGHYPNEIATNIHRWTPAPHLSDSRKFRLGAEPAVSIPLEIPVTTDALRLHIRDSGRVSLREIRAFAPTKEGYPELVAPGNETPKPDIPNLLQGAKASASAQLSASFGAENVIDGDATNKSRWVKISGPHTLTISLPERRTLGCIHLYGGWRKDNAYEDAPADYTVQYRREDGSWVDIFRSGAENGGFNNLAADFHTYGMLWTPTEIVFYFEGCEIRREPNLHAHGEAVLYLSSAVIHWAGPVTDAIHGTSMDIDYVRVWQSPD